MSVHQRPTLTAPKLRQRVRMDGTVGTSTGARSPWNTHGPWGQYAECYTGAGCMWVRWAPVGTPPFTHAACAGEGEAPRLVIDHRARIWLAYAAGGDVSVTYSEDDGQTWTEGETMFASGTWPTIAVGLDGALLIAARVGGELQIRRRWPGDTAWEAAFTAQYDGGDLALEDDSFHLQQAPEGPARWVLHCRLDGETDTITLWSADDGETWEEF